MIISRLYVKKNIFDAAAFHFRLFFCIFSVKPQNFYRMKRLILFFLFGMGLLLHSQAQSGQDYDNENGTSMMPITYDILDLIEAIESKGYEIVRMEYDLIFDIKSSYRSLFTGYTYGAIAYGDYRIEEIGLRLLKKSGDDWDYVTDGEFDGKLCSIFLEPEENADYKFEIRALKFVSGYSAGHYGLIVFHN